MRIETCTVCDGTKVYKGKMCKRCNGTGYINGCNPLGTDHGDTPVCMIPIGVRNGK